jgi:hypothetical protein
MRSFYQGRLGTNIGKTFKWTVFSGQVQGPLDHFSWTGCVRTLRDWIAPAGFQGQFTHKGSMRSNCADWAYPCVRASVSLSHAPSRSLCVCLDASFCLSLSLVCVVWHRGRTLPDESQCLAKRQPPRIAIMGPRRAPHLQRRI